MPGPTPTIVSIASWRATAVLPIAVRSRRRLPTSITLVSCPPTGRLGLLQPAQPPAIALGTSQVITGSISNARRNTSSYIPRGGTYVAVAVLRLHPARTSKEEPMQLVQEIMTKQLHIVRSDTTVFEVARLMRDARIGDVLVTNRDGTLRGIITDRDIVVRAAAAGKQLDRTQVGEICTDR